jgi:putative transposase
MRRKNLRPVNESGLLLSRLIDEEYTRHPFYGRRKMVVFLKAMGHHVNRKRVRRLMRQIDRAGGDGARPQRQPPAL